MNKREGKISSFTPYFVLHVPIEIQWNKNSNISFEDL